VLKWEGMGGGLLEVHSLSTLMQRNVRKKEIVMSEIVMHMVRPFFPAAKNYSCKHGADV